MTSKHWTLVGGAVACLIAATYSSAAFSAPWLKPGDNRARFALQKLADRGHLNRTTSTWPVMMGTVHSGLGRGRLRSASGGLAGPASVSRSINTVAARDRVEDGDGGMVYLRLLRGHG